MIFDFNMYMPYFLHKKMASLQGEPQVLLGRMGRRGGLDVEDPAFVAPECFALIDSFENFKSSVDCITISSLCVEIAALLSRSSHSICIISESNETWESLHHIFSDWIALSAFVEVNHS
jgi:hypothetical protein